MTYNFDPDQWYNNQRLALESAHRRGDLADAELQRALAELDKRYEVMVDRLDGTFSIPDTTDH